MYYADELVYADKLETIAKYVDEKALISTFTADGNTQYTKANLATVANTSSASIVVGMSTNTNTAGKRIAVFGIEGTTSDSAIKIDSSNGNDAKGTPWSTY